ncbi:MAG TPA: VWA domain-containing protein [Candidatus Kapabacteria bacterium]|nr:VWA domain-containing protein [Candidatus Kapabacteria bacterium]
MIFVSPGFFYLFIIIPFLIVWYVFTEKNQKPKLQVSTLEPLIQTKTSAKQIFRHILFVLRILLISTIIVILARPQSTLSHKEVKTEGIDIVVALDISTSMEAKDFSPNRLEAAKKTAIEFIDNRPDDRIGLVIFAAESFTQCPLTTDHSTLKNLFEGINTNMVEDGTAIGLGLATAVNRLMNSTAKSKVIILITDGVNNTGYIAPMTATEIAKSFKMKVYAIGVGTRGMAPYPFKTPFGIQYQNIEVQIDEDLLKQVSNMTGGKYFRATNNKGLKEIYTEIDKMEKTAIDELTFSQYRDEFLPLAILAAILIAFEIILSFTVFRRVP